METGILLTFAGEHPVLLGFGIAVFGFFVTTIFCRSFAREWGDKDEGTGVPALNKHAHPDCLRELRDKVTRTRSAVDAWLAENPSRTLCNGHGKALLQEHVYAYEDFVREQYGALCAPTAYLSALYQLVIGRGAMRTLPSLPHNEGLVSQSPATTTNPR